MADKPSNYWLKNTKLAFTQDGGSDIPEKYLWYDDLHLPSHFQTVLARMAANAVYNVESLP